MKKLHSKFFKIITFLFLTCNHLFAQRWDLGGNPDFAPPPNGLISNSNFFGGYQTASVRLGTGNVSRIFINGTTGPTAGYIGIGNNFLTPQWQLDVQDNTNLNINYNSVLGSPNGYRINGDKILSNPGTDNTFVGRNAGAAWVFPVPASFQQCTFVGENAGPVSTAQGCTFVGYNAGLNNTTGDYNTFIGSDAGENNTTGRHNTFLGHHAGLNNTTGRNNTYIGYHSVGSSNAGTGDNNTIVGAGSTGILSSGSSNCMYGLNSGVSTTTGSNNCMYGVNSGNQSQTGNGNSFFGRNSGFGNTTGNNNIAIGLNAGAINQTGNNNVIIGHLANMLAAQTNLSNAVAIGFQAVVSDNNKMILGNNNINVGIGLSGSAVGNGPQKKLEINETAVASATVANPTIPGTFGGSGLRFRKLTASTPTAAANGKVLTVNANGDVILVADQTSTVAAGTIFAQNGLNITGTSTVELGGTLIRPNTQIDFNGKIMTYSNSVSGLANLWVRGPDGGTYTKAVGALPAFGTPETNFYEDAIATSPNAAYGREMYMQAASSTVAANQMVGTRNVVNAFPTPTTALTGTVCGFWAKTSNTGPSAKDNFGYKAEVIGAGPNTPTNINCGYIASAINGPKNHGFFADMRNNSISGAVVEESGLRAEVVSNLSTTLTIGGDFKVTNGLNTYGIRTFAQGGNLATYGVHSRVPAGASGTSNYGIWAEAPIPPSSVTVSYAGYFQGNVFINGTAFYPSGPIPSDQAFKTNIDTIANALNILKQLKPRTFFYDTTNINNINFPNQRQYGLIAQDVQTILPELVVNTNKPTEYDSLGNITAPPVTFKSLNYNAFIAILIKGMQTQQRQNEKQDSVITALQSQMAALTSSVTSCCSSSAIRSTTPSEQNQLTVNLSDKDIIVLNQNVPNPFAEQTTITYNLPEQYKFAQIIFSTIDGRILKAVDINKKGRGTLTVFGSDLSSGLYTYSLIIDGKTFDTKKMVKSE